MKEDLQGPVKMLMIIVVMSGVLAQAGAGPLVETELQKTGGLLPRK